MKVQRGIEPPKTVSVSWQLQTSLELAWYITVNGHLFQNIIAR